jgi:methyl-accepting chemotaxis protein
LELSNAAIRIGNIVKLITDIAARTNLLALNATIEAARSGAAGKGFAVVAQEVKALATQTAHATYEIDGQISGMQTVTEESVTAIKRISDTMTWISQISSSVATSMEEQGTTTREIAHNVAEAAKGTAEVATNITDVSRAANETGSGSVQVLSSARSLVRQSDRLKKEVAKFLNSVRGNRPHALFNLVPRCQGKLHSSAPRHTAAGPDCRQPKVSYRRCKN